MNLDSPPTKKLRVLIAMGTRPEIIKQAPIVWAAKAHTAVETIVLHSGQHTDLAQPMLEYFAVQPDICLDLLDSYRTLPSLVGGCLQRMEPALAETKADVVVTQGDTATTAAISLSCFYNRIPVVHVEAGLRTGNLQSPWPEEFNRRLATLAADLHCAPTQHTVDKLLEENIPPQKIFLSGNPIVDALEWTLKREGIHKSIASAHNNPTIASEWEVEPLVVLTAHRRENFGKPLEDICSAVLELSQSFVDHRFIFVTHPNPHAGPIVRSILAGRSKIEVAPPLTYPEFIRLMSCSKLIISDSGGIQEEAPTLGVPLLVTRLTTERPEAVFSGAAELVGTDPGLIVRRATELLNLSSTAAGQQPLVNPFGDGQAGKKIISQIVNRYGVRA